MKTEMTQRYRKFKRGWGVHHVYDNQTGLSKSLETRNRQDAERLVHAMNEAERVPPAESADRPSLPHGR